MDALSDVLKFLRLEGAVYLNAEFTAPWCIRGNAASRAWGSGLPGPSTWRSSISSPQALRSGNRAIALVAEESGYESESAFNRAFKRIRHAARSLAPAADL